MTTLTAPAVTLTADTKAGPPKNVYGKQIRRSLTMSSGNRVPWVDMQVAVSSSG
jgi:hypothetical protein